MPVGTKLMSLRNNMEGGCRLLKDGTVSFAYSGHNLEVWQANFPTSNIKHIHSFDEEFDKLSVKDRPKFVRKRDPKPYQNEAHKKIEKIVNTKGMHKSFAFLFDVGVGKSKSLTDMNTFLYCKGEIDAAIILTPNILVAEQWTRVEENEEGGALQRDIHESIPNQSWLWNKTKRGAANYELLKEYNGLQTVVMNIDAAKTPRGYALLEDFIDRHKGRVNFAIDEIHTIGNPSSQRHKACVSLASKCVWKAGLSATPITKDLVSVFGIFKFLNQDILGFRYLGGFKRKYCILRWNGFGDEIVGHQNIEDLYEKIAPYSHRISQKEIGLEKIYDEFVFEMKGEQKKHYDRVKEQWLTALDNGEFATASIALTAAMKLHQISSGFLISDEGTVQYLENARLAALDAWLDTLPADEKVVIWVRFKIDAEILCKHFGDKAVDLSGNVDSEDRIKNKELFVNDENIRFAIATPQASGVGTDGIQLVCNRAVFYTSSENFVNRKQAEGRTLRVGGSNVAFYTDLVCKGTGDRKILRNLTGKQELSSYTLDEVRSLFE